MASRVIEVDGCHNADQICDLVAEHFDPYLKPASPGGQEPARH
jgi:hypothetical protein